MTARFTKPECSETRSRAAIIQHLAALYRFTCCKRRRSRGLWTSAQSSPEAQLPGCIEPTKALRASWGKCPGWNCCTTAALFAEQGSKQGRMLTAAKAACLLPYGPEMETLCFLQARYFPLSFSSSCELTPSMRPACVELAGKHPGRGTVYKYNNKSRAPVSLRLLSNMLSKRYIKVCRHFVN